MTVAYFMVLSRLLPRECENSPVIVISVPAAIGTGHTRIKGANLTSCASLTKYSGGYIVCVNTIYRTLNIWTQREETVYLLCQILFLLLAASFFFM
jgi:hypothetical protein